MKRYISVACTANEMNVNRIVTADQCSIMAYHHEMYVVKKQKDAQIVLDIHFDEYHTSFTTYYVSNDQILRLLTTSVETGLIRFMKFTICEIYKGQKKEFKTDVDCWEHPDRKKINDVYDVIKSSCKCKENF